MQIGSVSTAHTPPLQAPQGAQGPTTPPTVSPHHRDKDGDNDNSTTTAANSATGTGQQVNVVA